MDRNPEPTGIERLGDLPWGTHFCLFYETKQDLLETLLSYFKAGLANHEFCLWITSNSTLEEAQNAFRQGIPGADKYLEAGDIEILSFQLWYLKDGAFNTPQATNGWNAMLTQALGKGYAGMRAMVDKA